MTYPDLLGAIIGMTSILMLCLIYKHSDILEDGNVKGEPDEQKYLEYNSTHLAQGKDSPVKTLKIDDKFSIVYDENNNDRPLYVGRHGSRHSNIGPDTPNWIISMFYTLREQEENRRLIVEANEKISELQTELSWANEPTCY